ncbi:hypothetical protein [Saccharomonospora halophila]|uniref:hypothetical protein n=1 Tax=Saccharomonospora halophila TaxID=129922 RepID=UPI00035CDF63|nr:hypothetical protein [Saccharomonospora halophila]
MSARTVVDDRDSAAGLRECQNRGFPPVPLAADQESGELGESRDLVRGTELRRSSQVALSAAATLSSRMAPSVSSSETTSGISALRSPTTAFSTPSQL